ncbi:RNA polymerase sigma factor (sigma-70 family) [Streptomyces sp. TLI_235]|nr:sigma-70 family RNA polymerase sigma factor [Streptomyces sp. TLI_235]PBC66288.1 RNA polymerase sigma factor (sigma-70 family) [Streptomyces sp. TLI_235]
MNDHVALTETPDTDSESIHSEEVRLLLPHQARAGGDENQEPEQLGPDEESVREFAEFVARTDKKMFRRAYVLCGNQVLAQDLMQDAYRKFWANWDGYYRKVMVAGSKAETNLTLSAVESAFTDHFRKFSNQKENADEMAHEDRDSGHLVDVEVMRELVFHEVRTAVSGLEVDLREVVVAVYFEERSLSAAARRLDISESTARRRHQRALKVLRDVLENRT